MATQLFFLLCTDSSHKASLFSSSTPWNLLDRSCCSWRSPGELSMQTYDTQIRMNHTHVSRMAQRSLLLTYFWADPRWQLLKCFCAFRGALFEFSGFAHCCAGFNITMTTKPQQTRKKRERNKPKPIDGMSQQSLSPMVGLPARVTPPLFIKSGHWGHENTFKSKSKSRNNTGIHMQYVLTPQNKRRTLTQTQLAKWHAQFADYIWA